MRIKDPNHAYELLAEFGTPENVIKHGEAVARVAVKVGERLNEKGLDIDINMAHVCGLLHDMARVYPEHQTVAKDWLMERGYEEEAEIIGEHMHYPEFNDVMETTPLDLICLGDRVCIENAYVGPEKRFAYIFDKHSLNPARKPILDAKKHELITYIDHLGEVMGISLDDLMAED